jgi:transposase
MVGSQMTPLKTTPDAFDDIRFRPLKRNAVLRKAILDQLLATDHPVRLIDAFVANLDVSLLLEPIRAREGCPGAPVLDPRMLLAVWLFGTIEGITSARELDRRCRRDLPYLWLSGQTRPNYHTLADFFSENQAFLESTFEEHLEVLLEQGLITLAQVTVDGRKIPASASKESFHREPTLSRHRQEAQEHLSKLKGQRTREEQTSKARQKAQERAARDRQQRLDAAVEMVQKRQQERALRDRKDAAAPEEARASETDPDARKMKMSHGGFVPAYNTQTVTDAEHGLIVAVQVTEQASDNGLLGTLLEKVEEQTGQAPAAVLVDGGYASQTDIQKAESNGTKIYMPPKTARAELKQGKNPYQRKRDDTKEIERWRVRMGTPEAQAIYQRRAPVAEGVHAQQSNRGWKRFRLRGLVKAGVEALWQALAHNLRVLMARNRLSRLIVRAAATA